jgi:rhodanese-related sulfurtransferase
MSFPSQVYPAAAASAASPISVPPALAVLPHGGGIGPVEAWQLVKAGLAVLVDVRTAEERKFVGHVPDSLHVPWATGTALTRNPRFARELEAKVGLHQPTLLICRSGKRSALALEVAVKAGFSQIANVLEGFEGDLDEHDQRGHFNGWRHHGLPWLQD